MRFTTSSTLWRLSVKDYTDLKNKQADTLMRQSFAKLDDSGNQITKEDIMESEDAIPTLNDDEKK